ncbi:MAG: DUF4190 domain-containing protein [Pirellulaceae bacterium]|nr:DUF4190 domain-containing protein [Pirellulaceae bacterium]
MSTNIDIPDIVDRMDQYRAISSTAIVALVCGLFALAALLSPWMLMIPFLGIVMGLSALSKIKQRPTELTGKPIAMAGLIMSSLLFVGSAIMHSVIYATEVPDGYQRISFQQLQPDDQSKLPIPDEAISLDGKRIFVKGYVYPGDNRTALRQFILVPDMGTCCFGGNPALTDMIEVTLQPPKHIDFSWRKRKLGGILHVDTKLKPVSGLNGVYYRLDAEYLD